MFVLRVDGVEEGGGVGNVHQDRDAQRPGAVPDRIQSFVVDADHGPVGIRVSQAQFLGHLQAGRALGDIFFQSVQATLDEIVLKQQRVAPLGKLGHGKGGEAAGETLDIIPIENVVVLPSDGVCVVHQRHRHVARDVQPEVDADLVHNLDQMLGRHRTEKMVVCVDDRELRPPRLVRLDL